MKDSELNKSKTSEYDHLIRSARVNIAAISRDGEFLVANQAAANHLDPQATPESIAGKHLSDFYSPEAAASYLANIRKICDTGEGSQEEFLVDGGLGQRWYWTDIEPMEALEGKSAPGVHVIAYDITDKKEALENRDKGERRLQRYFQCGLFGMGVADSAGHLFEVSPRLFEMLGYTEEEMIGMSVFNLSHPEDTPLEQERFNAILDGSSDGYCVDKRMLRKDKSIIHVTLDVRVIRDQAGDIDCLIGLVQDVSDRVQTEAMLRESQKMDAVGRLAGGMAHEFNNILGAIFNFCQLAGLETDKGSVSQRRIDGIFTAAKRARDLVNQILLFSRKLSKNSELIELNTIVNEVLDLLRSGLPSNIRIERQIPKEPIMIIAHPIEIHQLILNLCTNAANAIGDMSGNLIVKLEQLLEEGKPPFAKIVVWDNGKGISKEVQGKMFEPFFTTKNEVDGAGLGLSIVHGIVKRLNGEISVKSEPSHGAEFEVLIPAVAASSVSLAEEQKSSNGMGRIMLVDDEDLILDSGKSLLESLGYLVTAFSSPIEALAEFEKNPDIADLIISDQSMPGMPGNVLLRKMRELRSDIPTILCSGFGGNSSELETESMATTTVSKPYTIDTLSKAVSGLLHSS